MSDQVDAVSARFVVLADSFPGLLLRLLEPFAKRDLTPDSVRAVRQGAERDDAGGTMRVEIALDAMPSCMTHLVAGNLGQVVGVQSVHSAVAAAVPETMLAA